MRIIEREISHDFFMEYRRTYVWHWNRWTLVKSCQYAKLIKLFI